MGKQYSVMNGPAPLLSAAQVAVTTGTALKTMLQISTSANRELRVKQHWIEFDGYTAATPIKYELLRHASGGATVTAYVAADITKVNDPNCVAPAVTLGTSASGYTASAEGTPLTLQQFEAHLIPPSTGLYIQYGPGDEPELAVSTFLRQRVTAGTAVNAYCGVKWEE